jgi:hypothetical protein
VADVARQPLRLYSDDPVAIGLLAALQHRDVETLTGLLADSPSLATCWVDGRSALHLLAPAAPGPGVAALVTVLVGAGADPDAQGLCTWDSETPLHRAATYGEVELIEALVDAGADVDHLGSCADGGPPMSSAIACGQWAAARRLWESGAGVDLSAAAALGLVPRLVSVLGTGPKPGQETGRPTAQQEICAAFWQACRAGQLAAARLLLEHGAGLDWPAPWSGETPLEVAQRARQLEVWAWLLALGARAGQSRPAVFEESLRIYRDELGDPDFARQLEGMGTGPVALAALHEMAASRFEEQALSLSRRAEWVDAYEWGNSDPTINTVLLALLLPSTLGFSVAVVLVWNWKIGGICFAMSLALAAVFVSWWRRPSGYTGEYRAGWDEAASRARYRAARATSQVPPFAGSHWEPIPAVNN